MNRRVWTSEVNYTYSPEQLLVLVGKLHKQLLGSLAALGKVLHGGSVQFSLCRRPHPHIHLRRTSREDLRQTSSLRIAKHICSIMTAGPSYEGSIDRHSDPPRQCIPRKGLTQESSRVPGANQHIIELGGLPQEPKRLCHVGARLQEMTLQTRW